MRLQRSSTRRLSATFGVVALVALVASGSGATGASVGVQGGDWTTFDYNAARTGVGPAETGITASNLSSLQRRTVHIDGTVDSAPIELHAVPVGSRTRDVVVVTTSYGHTIALDPRTGQKLWEFVPPGTNRLERGPQIVTATPVADPDRQYVYAGSPTGVVYKLSLGTGHVIWSRRVTFDPTREKLEGALNIGGSGSWLLVATGGYDGDAPVYQGHLVAINRANGAIAAVFNTLCSDRRALIDPPSSCHVSDSALLERAGSVIEPDGDILIATGNAPFNGHTNWGDSVLELSPALRLLHNYTPLNQSSLNTGDVDLGSTDVALLGTVGGRPLGIMEGKDGIVKLLDLARLDGTAGPAGPRTGGQLQEIQAPDGGQVFTQPAVMQIHGRANAFLTDFSGTADYVLGSNGRLHIAWENGTSGSSPVIAGGLLYVYDVNGGKLDVYRPADGHLLASLPANSGHWNSPIVVGGRIIVPEGNDNNHQTSGTIDIYHLPGY